MKIGILLSLLVYAMTSFAAPKGGDVGSAELKLKKYKFKNIKVEPGSILGEDTGTCHKINIKVRGTGWKSVRMYSPPRVNGLQTYIRASDGKKLQYLNTEKVVYGLIVPSDGQEFIMCDPPFWYVTISMFPPFSTSGPVAVNNFAPGEANLLENSRGLSHVTISVDGKVLHDFYQEIETSENGWRGDMVLVEVSPGVVETDDELLHW